MSYNLSTAQRFLDEIFINLHENEHILTWASPKQNPGYPMSAENFLNKAIRSKKEKACYYSTATAFADPNAKDKHGKQQLYNRQSLFSRMFVVVLDDVGEGKGMKCTFDSLPESMQQDYSYRIESSPGNWQYGFILDEPIENLSAAKEFVKIVYGAGPWDSGGAMPNKLVRMPCGNNLKAAYHDEDGKLWSIDGYEGSAVGEGVCTWTPDEILTAIGAGVTWQDILDGTAARKDPRGTRGTTAWRPGVFHETMTGVVDEIVEWQNENDQVVDERPGWLTIRCMNAEEHTSGDGTAGYSPLEEGDQPHRRGFNCFHEHCRNLTIVDYLAWVVAQGGPIVPVVDPVPGLVARWAFDSLSNSFIDMQSKTPIHVPNAGFKTGHQGDVFWQDWDGKPKKATIYGLITKAPGLLTLYGSACKPGGERIIEHEGVKRLNTWTMPLWAGGTAAKAEPFVEFIKYLLPNDGEWFLDHVASKAQDPTYRGPGVIMSTPAQGTGRGTLGKMLSGLWGSYNVASLGLSEMLGGLTGEGFNEFLTATWTIVPEAREGDMTRRQEARAYETLKVGVDPEVTSHLIKHKYGGQGPSDCYSSTIICSNHSDVLNIPLNDRRFKFIECTVNPAEVAYFQDLNEWLKSAQWQADVWAFLLARDVSHHDGFARVNEIPGGERERVLSKLLGQSAVDRLVSLSCLYADQYLEGVLATRVLCDQIASQAILLGVAETRNWEEIYKRNLQSSSAGITVDGVRQSFKIDGTKYYLRHTLTALGRRSCKQFVRTHTLFEKMKANHAGEGDVSFVTFCAEAYNEIGL